MSCTMYNGRVGANNESTVLYRFQNLIDWEFMIIKVHDFFLYSYILMCNLETTTQEKTNKISKYIGNNNIAKTIICTKRVWGLYLEGDKKFIKYFYYKCSTLNSFSNLLKKMGINIYMNDMKTK